MVGFELSEAVESEERVTQIDGTSWHGVPASDSGLMSADFAEDVGREEGLKRRGVCRPYANNANTASKQHLRILSSNSQ